MATDIAFPVKVDPRGGAHLAEGSSVTYQNILLGVYPASSRNPWSQDITPPEDTLFELNDEQAGGRFEAHVYDLFDELKRLGIADISRDSNAVSFNSTDAENGNLDVTIKYVDLEEHTNREITFTGGDFR